ncbi:MAG: hypothetical protein DRQ78_10225 [Epsilonproteobacteria bacterium]|nr:MAG: hypothetical protein DRQ78_10225 [Campylobacterota bacterium]
MKYNTQELDKLVDEWIAFRYHMNNAKTKTEEDKLQCYDMELMDNCIISKLPKLALSIIVQILEKDSSDRIVPVLAAGELEDILSLHGENIIELIEQTAHKNLKFKKLLGGIWQANMSDEIYKRVINAAGGEEKKW